MYRVFRFLYLLNENRKKRKRKKFFSTSLRVTLVFEGLGLFLKFFTKIFQLRKKKVYYGFDEMR